MFIYPIKSTSLRTIKLRESLNSLYKKFPIILICNSRLLIEKTRLNPMGHTVCRKVEIPVSGHDERSWTSRQIRLCILYKLLYYIKFIWKQNFFSKSCKKLRTDAISKFIWPYLLNRKSILWDHVDYYLVHQVYVVVHNKLQINATIQTEFSVQPPHKLCFEYHV